MIDCNVTKNYFSEKARMSKTTKSGICKVECTKCPLSSDNNGVGECCTDFEMLCPEQAIKVVQRWSDEHPPKTYLSEFLKHYPNAELNHGVPKSCLKKLGVVSGCPETKEEGLYISCYRCWNQPIKDGEE